MSTGLVCTFTGVGLTALVNARANGLQAQITHLAVGRGITSGTGYASYTPTRADTRLRNEAVRVSIISAHPLGEAYGFRVLAQVPAQSLPAEYWIREVGAILSDGTLLAVWSDPDHPLAGKTATTDVDLEYNLFLDGMPEGLLAVTVLQPSLPDTVPALAAMLALECRNFIETSRLNRRLDAARIAGARP